MTGGMAVDAYDASPEMVATAKQKFGVPAKVSGFADLDESQKYTGGFANVEFRRKGTASGLTGKVEPYAVFWAHA